MILASGSPRRASILRRLGLPFEVIPADIDETALPEETPEEHVERLSRAKAETVAERFPGRTVLAGDTVVVLDGEILGKPNDAEDAVSMILRLQGRAHRVLSGLTLVTPRLESGARNVRSGVEGTAVVFRGFGEDLAHEYVRTGEPLDKAGGYGIQGLGATLVERVEGDYSTVVGLPVSLLIRLLDQVGRPYRFPEGLARHGSC